MSNGDRGTAIVITAGGPNPPSSSNVNIKFNLPVLVIGGNASFSGVPESNEPSALGGFLPPGTVQFGGVYKGVMLWALVNVPTGNTITGTITSDQALPFDVQIQSFSGGTFTLTAGETSGNFSFPFGSGSVSEAVSKGIV